MNKNTKQARRKGYCSKKDLENDGNKIFKGSKCDTRWDGSESNKLSRKSYKKNNDQ